MVFQDEHPNINRFKPSITSIGSPDDEVRENLLINWHGDFKRPRKIDGSEKTREVVLHVSEDEYNLLRSYAEGFSADALARAWQCHKSTIGRNLRNILLPAFQQQQQKEQQKKEGQ